MNTPSRIVVLALTALACATATLHAATRVKASNTDNLNLASSWTNALVPGSADVAQFDSTVTGSIAVALGANTTWNQLNFVNPGGDVTIGAGNSLTLSNNIPVLFGAGAANLTLDCDLVCAGTAFTALRSAPAGQTVTYNGAIQGRNVTVTLGNTTGTMRLGSPNSTLIGSVVQVNTAGLKFGIGASSVGDPIVSGPLGTNLFTWAASSSLTELFAYDGDQSLGNPVRIQFGPLVFNSADDLTFTGVIDLNNGSRTFTVNSNGVLRLTGVVSNGTAIVKTGTGTLELGGTNVSSWTSGLSIYGGTVRLLASDVIPDGPGRVLMTNVTEVLDLNGFSDTVSGLIGSGALGIWNGTLDNAAAGTTSVLTVGNNFTYILAGNLQNTGPGSRLALVKIGTGGLTISNANTFSGGLTNAAASKLYLNTPGAAGNGPVSLADPAAQLLYSGGGSITWTNDIILEAGTQPVIGAVDGSALEVAGVIGGPGLLWRAYNFSEQGPLTLSGDNTFTGGLYLYGGDLTLNHPRALGLGTLIIGDPVFTSGSIYLAPGVNLSGASAITNAILVNRDFTVGGTNFIEFAGPMVWITNTTQRSINVTNPAGAVISGLASGYGFNKTGQGLLTFNGVCTFNGPSTVSVGPLAFGPAAAFTGPTTFLVGGSGRLDVSAASGFAVASNQILTGTGSVKGDVLVNGELRQTSVTSSFTFSNNLTLATGSTTTLFINRNFQVTPRIVCQGALAYGGSLVVSNVGSALLAGDTFPLFSFSGSPGGFGSLTLPPLNPGLSWKTDNLAVDGTISVVSVPPPPPQLANPALQNSTNFVMTAAGGVTNGPFRVLTETNLSVPLANWVILSTNIFDGSGNLTLSNIVNPAEPQRFFIIVEP